MIPPQPEGQTSIFRYKQCIQIGMKVIVVRNAVLQVCHVPDLELDVPEVFSQCPSGDSA